MQAEHPPRLALAAAAKATVPVLGLADGLVLDQSLAIMLWALEQADPQAWWQGWTGAQQVQMDALIAENDGPFKHHLDRFNYPDRYPAGASPLYRRELLAILRRWSRRLAGGGWLLAEPFAVAGGAP